MYLDCKMEAIMVEKRDIDIILNNPVNWEIFRNKTVLVTGATGRLGMYIVEAISKANIDWNLNITIIILARNIDKINKVFGDSLKLPYIHKTHVSFFIGS